MEHKHFLTIQVIISSDFDFRKVWPPLEFRELGKDKSRTQQYTEKEA